MCLKWRIGNFSKVLKISSHSVNVKCKKSCILYTCHGFKTSVLDLANNVSAHLSLFKDCNTRERERERERESEREREKTYAFYILISSLPRTLLYRRAVYANFLVDYRLATQNMHTRRIFGGHISFKAYP